MTGLSRVPKPRLGDALLVVDVQNDFCPGGALAVPGGDQVVPILNAWIEPFRRAGRPIAYTQDWHPAHHVSFLERGGPWPPHCIQGSPGAQFHPNLRLGSEIFRKGFEPDRDAYSGFQGFLSAPAGTHPGKGLADWLRERGAERVHIGGLALDYCVKATTLDALRDGFAATVILGATRAVNVKVADDAKAVKEMKAAGARMLGTTTPRRVAH